MKPLHCLPLFLMTFVLQAQQGEVFETVSKRLYDYYTAAPVEKVYVHQDRSKYSVGETMWFKVYQSFSKGIESGSGIVYVDLLDGTNTLVAKSKWKLTDGMASGHIEIPDTLPSGKYLLTAYTKWMQNFDTDYYFSRELYIASSLIAEKEDEEGTDSQDKITLSFFPEGGNLVEGLPSKVAFKVTDSNGKGLDIGGIVLDEGGREILRFQPEQYGMGVFSIIPEKGKLYTARLDGINKRITLPEIYGEGVVLTARLTEDKLRLTLRHNLKPTIHPYHLTIHQGGTAYYNAPLQMDKDVIIADIEAEKLPEGVFTITIFDDKLLEVCERLAFIRYPEQLRLSIETDKEKYGNRSKVSFRIIASDLKGKGSPGNFSLSVIKSGLDDIHTQNNYYTDYFLQSELRGRIENPVSYFKERDLSLMNLLLMTHGWRRYRWDSLVSDTYPQLFFPVEQSLTFSGRIQLRSESQNPESVELTAMFRHDSIKDVVSTSPGKGGAFLFTGYDFTDTAEVILSAKDKRRTLDISMMTYPNPRPDYYSFPEIELTQEENDSIYVEIFGSMPTAPKEGIDKVVHQLPDIRVTAKRKRDPRSIHDPVFNIATYQVRKDLSYGSKGAFGILEYNVPKLRMTKITSRLNYEDLNARNYILDGMYVSQADLEMIPAFMIDRIEILSYGSSVIYGGRAIFFFTRSWEDMVYSTPVRTVSHKFAGYSRLKEFYIPNYEIENDYFNKDNRNTLHWEPNVTLNKEGKAEVTFFTSDDHSEYLIRCEGRSEDGVIGVGDSYFSVD